MTSLGVGMTCARLVMVKIRAAGSRKFWVADSDSDSDLKYRFRLHFDSGLQNASHSKTAI